MNMKVTESDRSNLLRPSHLIVGVIALLNIFIHIWFYDSLEYMRDELLYFAAGNHPALGYPTTPPLIPWLSFLLQHTIGYSLFAVRFVPALGSGILVMLSAALARELGGKDYAQILSASGVLIAPFALRTFTMYQPVFIDLIFWTTMLLLVLRFVNREEPKYLVYIGIIAGLAMLNKYLIALLLVTILIAAAFTQQRRIFRQKAFYIGLMLGALIFLPNLIWQIQNGFPVFHHLSELNRHQLVHVNRYLFLADQFIMPGPVIWLILAGLVFMLMHRDMRRYRFIGITAVAVIAALCLLRGKSYYTIGLFPMLLAAGAVYMERIIRNNRIRYGLIILITVLTIPTLPLSIAVYKTDGLVAYFQYLEEHYGLHIGRRFEDGAIHSLPQDYADMLGWEELTAVTSKAWQQIPDKPAAFIFADNYGQAGAISIIGKKYDLPEPVSFHDAYRNWVPASFDPDIEYFIYINDELGDDVAALFAQVDTVGSITNPHAREYGTTVYQCSQPLSSFNTFWKERLAMLE
jgi:hypothetical protein